MYKIYADNNLIYDSTIEDYKIGKGLVTLETNKSGSFVFSVYPDHFFYDSFVRLKTVITVYKASKIVFKGRILNDVTDYWNNKVITCEGELGFLQDSIIRPFTFSGTPEELFKKFIEEHNSQVDDFKKFKIGSVTVVDPNDYIARSNSNYESALSNLNSRLIEDSLGGYFYITHGEDGTDPVPTINYLADFTKVSSQKIEFGSNLKNYTKTVKAEEIATAIIPLGHEVDDGDSETENLKLTIESVNDGKDYVYSEAGVSLYGWITKVVEWNDVTDPANLKSKAEDRLDTLIKQNITIELTVIDLHLIDPTIESLNVCEYFQVISIPHNFDSTLLCNKQTIDLLKPENDSFVLGYTYSTFTDVNNKKSNNTDNIIKSSVNNLSNKIISLNNQVKTEYVTTKNMEEYVLENAGGVELTAVNIIRALGYTPLSKDELFKVLGNIELWNGSWSEGTITVEGTENYTLYLIKTVGRTTDGTIGGTQGTVILAIRNGRYIRGIGGYENGTPTDFTYHFAATVEGDDWTFVGAGYLYHGASGNHGSRSLLAVSEIIGVL